MANENRVYLMSTTNLYNILMASILTTGELLGHKFDVKIRDESYSGHVSIDCEYTTNDLQPRSMYIKQQGNRGFDVSFGIHSPSDLESDLVQKMIAGTIAEKILTLNLELSK
jgi:hypothetical protein